MTEFIDAIQAVSKKTILDEARDIVYDGERERAYGHPIKHFGRTIGMINALLAHKLREPLSLEDWARIMICDKLARSMNGYKRDHARDCAGYAATWARVSEDKEP